jgi:glycosyltransferase involved in cell wall biosynthesis
MLAGALDRAGADVTLLTRDHDLEFGGVPGASEAFIEREAPGVDLRLLRGRVRSPSGWRHAMALRRDLGRGDAVVHLQEAAVNDLRLLAAVRPRRGRFALTVHDPVQHPGDRHDYTGPPIERLLRRRAGLIFIHGEALKEELLEITPTKAPVVVIPHASDPGAGATPLPGSPSLLFFGRMSHYKGLDVLLDAMSAVWTALPDATLVVAGAGDIEPHAALSDPRVTVRNEHVPEDAIPDLMHATRCLVLPYRQASQSGVGSRAKPYGRPLVVTELGGLPELVSDGSGLVVPPEDPERLAEAILSLLTDRALAERLGAAGAATAERETSWAVVAERTLEAYREHLGVG